MRPGIALILFLYGLLSIAHNLKEEFIPADQQDDWRIFHLIPDLPWWAWLIGVLALLVLVGFEWSFRFARAERERTIALLERRFRILEELADSKEIGVDLLNRVVAADQKQGWVEEVNDWWWYESYPRIIAIDPLEGKMKRSIVLVKHSVLIDRIKMIDDILEKYQKKFWEEQKGGN